MYEGWTDEAILEEFGNRLRTERLNRNLTIEDLAASAGVSPKTVGNLEAGEGTTLTTVIRILRALGMVDRIDALLPQPTISPMELLRLQGRRRQRASG